MRIMQDEKVLANCWEAEVVNKSRTLDPSSELDWFSMWIGFVIALGRADLANYSSYMEIGFPLEK